jgi:4'-phosphopantetheinyl transferase
MHPVIYAISECENVTPDQYNRLLQKVTPERQVRAKRFLRFEDSCRSVVAEALLAYTLKRECGIDFNSITLIENQWKKPIIQGHAIHFNLTHSGSWVMCIIDSGETGIDVEKVKHVDFGIVPRFFSQKEQQHFNRYKTDEEKLDCFSTLWVLKESYIKAIGKGLYCPLDSFSVIPDSQNNVTLERHDTSLPNRFFRIYPIGEKYRCAACCSTAIVPSTVEIVTIEQLVNDK